MSDDDSCPPSNRPAPQHLLTELESIKGTLTDQEIGESALPTEIPLLDDMVIHNLDSNAALLNIDHIFEESTAIKNSDKLPPMQFPRFSLDVAISDSTIAVSSPQSSAQAQMPSSPPVPVIKSTATPRTDIRSDYSREVLIQQLVDEFIPQIEAALHERLRQLDETVLEQFLKEKK
ncbi:MAG TPA: hypothetical protein VGK97_01330 [Spongiibacteraceae bacterium]